MAQVVNTPETDSDIADERRRLMDLSRKHSREGNTQKALDAMDQAYELDIDDAVMAERYARALLKARRWVEARTVIDRLVETEDAGGTSLFTWREPIHLYDVDRGNGHSVDLNPDTLWEIGSHLRRRPLELLHVPSVRARLSRQRRHEFIAEGQMRTLEETDHVIKNAVIHNVEMLDGSADDGQRPNLLINPLMAIDYVNAHKADLDVLTIGPRSESELYCMVAAGLNPARIHGVDLISYTPLIKAGDAHALDFPDASFDVVIAGWVLAYSRTPQRIADEVMRVSRPHAYVAAGCAYTPPGRGPASTTGTNIQASRFSKLEDITDLFSNRLERVMFQSPVERERCQGTASLAAVIQLDG